MNTARNYIEVNPNILGGITNKVDLTGSTGFILFGYKVFRPWLVLYMTVLDLAKKRRKIYPVMRNDGVKCALSQGNFPLPRDF